MSDRNKDNPNDFIILSRNPDGSEIAIIEAVSHINAGRVRFSFKNDYVHEEDRLVWLEQITAFSEVILEVENISPFDKRCFIELCKCADAISLCFQDKITPEKRRDAAKFIEFHENAETLFQAQYYFEHGQPINYLGAHTHVQEGEKSSYIISMYDKTQEAFLVSEPISAKQLLKYHGYIPQLTPHLVKDIHMN